MKVGLISLGCSKNLVDSEMMLGLVKKFGATITPDPAEADIIIVNTCGFIEPAKEEAISTILEMASYDAKLVVTGCLTQRYTEELKEELPEVDLFIPIRDYYRFNELIAPLFGEEKKTITESLDFHNRVLSTPKHFAYVKISEGCDNRCHYCAIPLIRGGFVSRNEDDIVKEVEEIVAGGTREIVLISQDTTRYGSDFNDGTSICTLLTRLSKIKDIELLRVLYLYPEEMTHEFIDLIRDTPVIAPYFDIPIQHASNKILAAMNRRDTKEEIMDIINYIRTNIPHAILRTTIIVGYPGETEEDFEELLSFLKVAKFDRLGAFTYSAEDDTVAATLPNQIPEEIKKERYDILMELQQNISYDQNALQVGAKTRVVVEGTDEDGRICARDYRYAPDDIDGYIYIETDEELETSKYYDVEIVDHDVYNLYAELLEDEE